MPSYQKIEVVEKWTPKVAWSVVILFSLLVFWGIINLSMQFLEADSYFSVSSGDVLLSNDKVKERNGKIKNLLNEREQKRQAAGMPQSTLNSGEKDPFNLP